MIAANRINRYKDKGANYVPRRKTRKRHIKDILKEKSEIVMNDQPSKKESMENSGTTGNFPNDFKKTKSKERGEFGRTKRKMP